MKKYLFHILSSLLLIILSIMIGCKDTVVDSNIDQMIIPSSNVSYSQHIQPIFDAKCLNSGCHNDQNQAGGLSLTNWANTTSNPSIVFPEHPENSRLVWAIEGMGAPLMPPVTAPVTPLTENHREGIKTWIREGAKNN